MTAALTRAPWELKLAAVKVPARTSVVDDLSGLPGSPTWLN